MANVDIVDWYTVSDKLISAGKCLLPAINRVSTSDEKFSEKSALGCLIYKAHTDFEAMLFLCRQGFADSAQVLARSVIEACLNLLWIEQKPKERADLFWAYGIHQRARIGRKLHDNGGFNERNDTKLQEFEEFTKENPNRWPSLCKIVNDLGPDIKKKLHGIYYDWLSSSVHALPFALEAWYITHGENEVFIGRDSEQTKKFPQIDIPCVFLCGALCSTIKMFDISPSNDLDSVCDTISQLISHADN